VLEFLFQVLGELVLQLVAEVALELGLEGIARAADRGRSANPALAFLGYALLGAAVGGLSLVWLPSSFIRSPTWQLVNLVVTPLLAGWLMGAIGKARGRHRGAHTRLSTFLSGCGFALAMALVRYLWSRPA
jgi:hypothetical protein